MDFFATSKSIKVCIYYNAKFYLNQFVYKFTYLAGNLSFYYLINKATYYYVTPTDFLV